MAIQSIGPFLWPSLQPQYQIFNAGFSTLALNAADQRVAWVFELPRSGSITGVGLRTGTVTTAQTVRAGLYTVDSSGNPTTTLYGGSNFGTLTPAANTYHSVTLGTAATATAGTQVALVAAFDSTAGDITINTVISNANPLSSYPYASRVSGGTWTRSRISGWVGHLLYSDGVYDGSNHLPFTDITTFGSFHVNTAGADEFGLRVTLPFTARARGIWSGYTGLAEHECLVYRDTTVLATALAPSTAAFTNTDANPRLFYFSSPVAIAAGTTIRVAIRPTTTTALSWRRVPIVAQAAAAMLGLPTDAAECSRVDQGTWTDTAAVVPLVGLILDGLDDGASGLILPRSMHGGYSA